MSNQEGNLGASSRYSRGAMGVEGSFLRELGKHMRTTNVEKPARTRLERVKDAASSIVRGVVSGQEQVVPLPETETQIDENAPLIEIPGSDVEA